MHHSHQNELSIDKDLDNLSNQELNEQKQQGKSHRELKNFDELTQMLSLFKQFIKLSKTQTIKEKQDFLDDLNELQPRDRLVSIPLPKGPLTQDSLERFITKLCKIVWSRAFNYYSTQQVSYEYAKIYSSQQILRNIVRLSQKFHLTSQHFEIINIHLHQKVLQYKMTKYPITYSQQVNRNVNNAVRQIDNTDQPLNDYLYNSTVYFKFRQSGQYNDLIMRLINQILKKIEYKIGNKTVFQKFQQKMQRLFDSVLDQDFIKESQQQKAIIDQCQSHDNLQLIRHKYSITQQQFKKQLIKIQQKDKQKYRLKVQQYTSYKIGRKLNQSTRLFTQNQILSHNIKIQSPQILRILTKWCDQLENKFTTPNYFQHYIETIKLENGKFLVLVLNQVKEGLDQLMAEQYRNIKKQINQMTKNNYFMQSQLLFHSLKNVNSNQIEKYESIAAKYSIDIVNNLHSYTLAYLNRLIHGLLTVAIKFTKLPSVSHLQWPSNINLVTFQINDLIRCRCASGQKQIIKIYNQILRLCDIQKFRMIKVSNRLKRGTHDAVITVKYRQVICQIQLSVTNKRHKLIQYSNMFNHYLYQLKRSVFGPLTQLCNIWKSIDGRFNVYKNVSNLKKSSNSITKLQHQCKSKNQYQTYYRPFICSNCQCHYYHNNFIKHHFKCKYCNFWLCCRCQIDISDCKSMIAAAYKQEQIITRCNRLKRKGNTIIPDYGICIFIQSQSTKVQPFRKYINQNQTSIIGIKNRNLYRIYDISTQKDIQRFKQQYLIFEIGQAYGRKHIKIDDQKISEFFVSEKLQFIYQKNKQKICLNYNNIKNDQFISLCKMGTSPQKQNIKRLEIIGNKLQQITILANNFKNIKVLQVGKNNINQFTQIQKLQKLEILCVNQNKVQQFPNQVCHLWNLKQLSFCQNQIKILPDVLSNLHKLKVLRLSYNQISQFPKCISQLFYLNQLDLKHNKIKQIPSNISCLNQLQSLDLQNNQIQIIHNDFSKLKNLQNLNISFNQLTDFKNCLTSLKSLQRCNLRNNKISQVPATINQLQNLIFLNLSNNQISIFPSINSLTSLVQLNISYNTIENLPQFQNSYFSLKYLFATHNNLKLLPSFKNLIYLEELFLNNNHLQQIPESIGKLQKLEILHLENNEIIKICDLKLQILKYLNLSQNKISSFTNMDLISTQQIDLSSNCLANFSSNLLPCLKRFNLNNNIIQNIDLSYYPKLKYFYANMNKLQTFPKIQQKNHIKLMSLQHNFIKNFTPYITYYHNLSQLNLAYNQINIVSKQIKLLSSLKDHSLDLTHNPIQKIQNPEFIQKKATHLTLQELKPLLTNSLSLKSINSDHTSNNLQSKKSSTIEKI